MNERRVQVQGSDGQPRRYKVRRYAAVVPPEGGSLSPRAVKPDYKINPENGCWEWQKQTLRGYGQGSFISVGIETQWAHVAYWVAANGPLPQGRYIVIDHLCRRPICVNPKHLEAVEQATNIHRGKGAKLNMQIAREVRRRVAAGQSSNQIKDELGVSIQNIWWIAEDRAWREDPTAPRNPVRPIRDCEVCGEPIPHGRHRAAIYCSDRCKYRRERQRKDAA